MKTNSEWHEQNALPGKATDQQRIAWHLEHAKQCGCRPIPKGVVALLRAHGIAVPSRRTPADRA